MSNYSWNTAITTRPWRERTWAKYHKMVLSLARRLLRTWKMRVQAMTTRSKMSLRTVHVFGLSKTVTNHFSNLITRTSLRSAVRVHNSVCSASSNSENYRPTNTSSSTRCLRPHSKWTRTTKIIYLQPSNNGLNCARRYSTFDISTYVSFKLLKASIEYLISTNICLVY